jgi:hypothetical protein
MSVWLAHAILALVAWGLLVPVSTIIATFRCLIFRGGTSSPLWERAEAHDSMEGRTWVKIHRFVNETVILSTWILFILAVVGVRKGNHFKKTHQVVGLLIFLSTFPLWAMGRILMPRTNPNNRVAEISTTESTVLLGRSADDDNKTRSFSTPSSSVTTILVRAHKIVGMIISVAALWEIYSGISMLTSYTNGGLYFTNVFICWCCFLAFTFGCMFLLLYSRGGANPM